MGAKPKEEGISIASKLFSSRIGKYANLFSSPQSFPKGENYTHSLPLAMVTFLFLGESQVFKPITFQIYGF